MESTLSRNESLLFDSASIDLSDSSDSSDSPPSITIESSPSEIAFDASSINNEDDSLDVGGLSEQFENMNISKVDDMNISEMKRETSGDQLILHEGVEQEQEVEQEVDANISENSLFGQERICDESFDIFTRIGNDDDTQEVCSPNVSAIERAFNRDKEEEKMNATFINLDSSICQTVVEGDSVAEAVHKHSSVRVLKCTNL
jgi:hypothetical protein